MIFNRGGTTSSSTSSHSDQQLVDHEFGAIVCKRSPRARHIRLRVSDNGELRATLPPSAGLHLVQELIDSSREQIRALVSQHAAQRTVFIDGTRIGHSHQLLIVHDDVTAPRHRVMGQTIRITLPRGLDTISPQAQAYIALQAKKALKREAHAYLPRRLKHLADIYGFNYAKVRFANQKGRWGSCSSSGTISLNVALMNQPLDIIDYVLVHELAHTRQMNHSQAFWDIVADCIPDYKQRRKLLKTKNPTL